MEQTAPNHPVHPGRLTASLTPSLRPLSWLIAVAGVFLLSACKSQPNLPITERHGYKYEDLICESDFAENGISIWSRQSGELFFVFQGTNTLQRPVAVEVKTWGPYYSHLKAKP